MLPVIEPDGRRMFNHVLWFSFALIPVSLIPFVIGMSGSIYFTGVLIAGIILFKISRSFAISHSNDDAKKLLRATVIYLPVLLFLIIIDISF